VAGAESRCQEIVEVGRVTEEKHSRQLFFARELAKELERLGAGKKEIGASNLVSGVFEFGGEDLGGLESTQVGAGEEQVRGNADFGDAFGDQVGFLHAFLGEEALGIGGTLGVFPVDGDAVANDVELHEDSPETSL